jgi:hypothetical protein
LVGVCDALSDVCFQFVAKLHQLFLQLELFAEKWDAHYPLIAKSWRANWSKIEPMFQFPAEIRRAIYTTNVVELRRSSFWVFRKFGAKSPVSHRLLFTGNLLAIFAQTN